MTISTNAPRFAPHPHDKKLRLAITATLEPLRATYVFDQLGDDFRNRVGKRLEDKGLFDEAQDGRFSMETRLVEYHLAIAHALFGCHHRETRSPVEAEVRKQIETEAIARFLDVDVNQISAHEEV